MKTIGLELAAAAGIKEVSTNAVDGTLYVQLTSTQCAQVSVINNSGVPIVARYCAPDGTSISGSAEIVVPDGGERPLRGVGNANQVKIKRSDGANVASTVQFYYEGVAST